MLTGNVTGLRGVDLAVRDVAAHARFYADVWRLTVVAERGGSVYLRGSGASHHIVALHPGNEPALLCINLAAADREAVDRLYARVAAAGAPQLVAPDDFVIEYTAEIEQVDDNYHVREPKDWAYPAGHSDLWGATTPPSDRMKAAQQKIRFAEELFHP